MLTNKEKSQKNKRGLKPIRNRIGLDDVELFEEVMQEVDNVTYRVRNLRSEDNLSQRCFLFLLFKIFFYFFYNIQYICLIQ
jgi:hypothetical protein